MIRLNNLHDYCIDIEKRIIYLHSIYDDSEGEPALGYKEATTFIKNFNLLESLENKPITIYLNSCGGCWNDGMTIFDRIKLSKCHTTIIGSSIVASMAAIIFQAGTKRLLFPNAEMLIHYGLQNNQDLSPQAQFTWSKNSIKNTNKMIQIFVEKMKKAPYFARKTSKVKSFLLKNLNKHHDWLLSAEESIKYGLADEVITCSI